MAPQDAVHTVSYPAARCGGVPFVPLGESNFLMATVVPLTSPGLPVWTQASSSAKLRANFKQVLVGPIPGTSDFYLGAQSPVPFGHADALLISESHTRLRDGSWNGGGPFYTYKFQLAHEGTVDFPLQFVGYRFGTWTITGVAGVTLAIPLPSDVPTFGSFRPALMSQYASAYAKAMPGNPVAGLGQFLVELRDLPAVPFKRLATSVGKAYVQGVKNYGDASRQLRRGPQGPRTWLRKKQVPFRNVGSELYQSMLNFRSLGSEWLNYQFGWKPFVSDLRKAYRLWQNIDKQMAQLVRDNGRRVRRRVDVSDETTTSPMGRASYGYPFANVSGAPPNYGFSGSSDWSVAMVTTRKVWMTGTFQYYIPDTGSSQWTTRARLALFGALPTPELLWEVVPWSWLVDWFSNVGDVIHNSSPNAVDNLICRESYMMQHITESIVGTCAVQCAPNDQPGYRWPAVNTTFKTTSSVEVKMRMGGGNPYGLNSRFDGLTGHQLGILAALGISRGAFTYPDRY